MIPKGELIKIMERVGKKVLQPEKNPFRMDNTPRKHECAICGDVVIARHREQRARYIDGLALQASNTLLRASDPPTALTKFIHNLESWVFTNMQSAPPQEFNKEYGLPKEGKPEK